MRKWDWQDWVAFIFDFMCLAFLLFVGLSPFIIGGVPFPQEIIDLIF